MEAQLEENLESFFRQDYPEFEIILGARGADDGGLELPEKFDSDIPRSKAESWYPCPPTWPNAKVFSLSKMIPLSTNDYFVISDSDVRSRLTSYANVIPTLLDPRIGLLTCPYRGVRPAIFGQHWKPWGCR